MFRHCVMFKFKAETSSGQRQEIAERISALAELPMVRNYQFGADAGLADGNFDFALVADFDDSEAYQAYAVDPIHVAVLTDYVRPNISARAAVQYQLD
ncbi:MAG: Dabb family protein [Pseudomonadales bacterium]